MAAIESLPEEVFGAALEGEINTIKSWLLQGGDPDQSLEEEARNCVRLTEENRADYEAYGRPDVWTDLVNRYTEAADILEGTRLAGHSYKRWVLKDYMALLRLRSLLARGRARAGPETPEVAKRLFNGVPDPCFWKVVEYAWLGDWRQP